MDKVNILDAVNITNNRVKPFEGTKRYLATGDLSGDQVDDSIVSVDYQNKPSRADLLVHKGNVIVARMQATNKVLLIDERTDDLIVSTGFLTLAPKDSFNEKYLSHYFRSPVFQRDKDKFCSGATQKAINNGSFGKLQVPKYSLTDQEAIADKLDEAEILRQKRKEQLALLDDYLKSVFLDMFGDPIVNEKKLPQISLGEVSADIKYGTNMKCLDRKKDKSVPVLRIPNIQEGGIDLTDLKYAEPDHTEFNKLLLRKKDLLFVRTNGNPDYIGRCAVFHLNDDYINASYLIRVRLKEKADLLSSFICYVVSLPSYRSKITKESRTTAGNYNINTQGLKNLKILKPSIDSQNKFLTLAEKAEETKQKMRVSLDEMDNHFNALMQRYFE